MDIERRIAVLIDADNVSAKYTKSIFDEISNHGTATYKRIYGDWTKSHLTTWKTLLLDYSITPIQQYSYTVGKNSSDAALIIDAMDILYSRHVDGFCLVSSDSDFTKLAARLREAGMYVIGMGEKKTPAPFISACGLFKYLEVLAETSPDTPESKVEAGKPEAPQQSLTNEKELVRTIRAIVTECSDDDGWASLAEVGNKLNKRYPDFDTRNYGFSKLTQFMASLKRFEVQTGKPSAPKTPNKYIKNKR